MDLDSGIKSDSAARKAAIYTYSAVADAMSAKEQNGRLVAYAEKNGMEVVKTYADEGGVRKNRERMFAEIADGTADFDVLLLRDITRWGRFPNPDEATAYEFACARAGIRIVYVNEAEIESDNIVPIVHGAIKRIISRKCDLLEAREEKTP